MECRTYRVLIQEIEDPNLNDDLKSFTIDHLKTCGECRNYQKNIGAVGSLTAFMKTHVEEPQRVPHLPSIPFGQRLLVWVRALRLSPMGAFALGLVAVVFLMKPQGERAQSFSYEASVGVPTLITLSFPSERAVKDATLVLATGEGVEFVGSTEEIDGQMVLRLVLDLQPGQNEIPVVIRGRVAGKYPVMASLIHNDIKQNKLIEMQYKESL